MPPSTATTAASARGAVFTRPEVADALLDLAGYTEARPLATWRLLEPAFGAGDLLLPALTRLLAAFTGQGGAPREVRALRTAIVGVELHAASFAATRTALRKQLIAWGASEVDAAWLCAAWLRRGDFLRAEIAGRFEVVLGNPPYVRQERIADDLLAKYRARYATIYDRADLYVPFFERGLELLAEGGRLAYLCADRWHKNRYGGPLRALVARDFHLERVIGLHGADVFQREVDAYPAITVIRRGRGTQTQVARGLGDASALPGVVAAMIAGRDDPRIEVAEAVVRGGEPWLLDEAGLLQVIRRLEAGLPTLEEAGCRVGIGVATGADRVFIGDLDALPVEPARKLPLVMASDLRGAEIVWAGRGVVNPFAADGSIVALDRWPRFAAHMRAHHELLAARHVARRGGDAWLRTIDRIDPALQATEKLLIPDIKGEAVVAHDPGRYYPHHNLYHVTASAWDLQALATILRSSLALLFVASYGVKMAGGFLRFQAQYLRRIRVPRWETLTPELRAALRAAAPGDRAAIDAAAFAACGLTAGEAARVTRAAAAARVQ